MDIIKATQNYIIKMFDKVPGMKVAVLDKDTTGIMSMVFAQSQVLQQEVYLFELLTVEGREEMMHLKAVVFVRPTAENIAALVKELKAPKYGEYHLFFSNILLASDLEQLAEADIHQIVQQVHEYYADVFPINPDTFSLNIESCAYVEPSKHKMLLERITEGIGAAALSLKRRPIVRYEKKSQMCEQIARELERRMEQERALFHSSQNPVLLIIDRRSDPITPLLLQWSYQAMTHELLEIHNNRVNMRHVQDVKDNLAEIVLSAEMDEFYRDNIYSNFGELAINVKSLLDRLQQQHKITQNIQSIEDMKSFVENYPAYQQLSGNVNKHITLLTELSKIESRRSLMTVSEVEQELACSNDHSVALKSVGDLLNNPRIQPEDKLRAVMLYALRYEKHTNNNTRGFIDSLQKAGVTSDQILLIYTLLSYAGEGKRSGDAFSNKSFLATLKTSFKKGLQGATCVYTQHKPALNDQLEDLINGKLSEMEYPIMGAGSGFGSSSRTIPRDIIVFICGGTTYEEAKCVHDFSFNNRDKHINVILGGTTIHNTTTFLQELRRIKEISKDYV